MLSYRKSQQVSLTEKLKMKNVIHAFGVSGSGTTMARLCLSAFARGATEDAELFARSSIFASAHSRGLRQLEIDDVKLGACFASAHSRGLRRASNNKLRLYAFFASAHSRGLRLSGMRLLTIVSLLCLSAFARVATLIMTFLRKGK